MRRNMLASILAVSICTCAYAEGISLVLSLPSDSFSRGVGKPVEGLIANLVIRNNNKTPLLLPQPVIHPEAAPGMAAEAVIVPLETEGEEAKPIERVPGMATPFNPSEVPSIRLEGESQAQVKMDVGAQYLIRKSGKYSVFIRYRGVDSNKVEFTVLPFRRVEVPGDKLLDNIKEIEWGEPDYSEMFYIVKSPRAWDEIKLVKRLGKGSKAPLVVVGISYLASGTMPEMVIAKKGVYALLYRNKTNDGWVVCVADCSVDPVKTKYKYFKGEEKPDLQMTGAEMME